LLLPWFNGFRARLDATQYPDIGPQYPDIGDIRIFFQSGSFGCHFAVEKYPDIGPNIRIFNILF